MASRNKSFAKSSAVLPPPSSPKPPAPSPPPSPPPSPTPVCPPLEWKCSECSRLTSASAGRFGTGLELPASSARGRPPTRGPVTTGFATAPNTDVLLGCLSCAGTNGGSGCSLICAAKSPDAAAMGACADCAKRGGNAWDCGACYERRRRLGLLHSHHHHHLRDRVRRWRRHRQEADGRMNRTFRTSLITWAR
ncbi:hypothetical protein PLESTM_001860800 [Pleodorina starrii]|nr:hypothetical protein PLESTM_001860800 [Pleodorina starrii]